jgi:hypothetical protein
LIGAVALAGNALRDGDGYFNSPTETFTTNGYAIAMKSVDVSDAPQWALDLGVDSVRVKSQSDRPLFIGIARSVDVERYLDGTEHDDVSHLNYHPFQVDYDHSDGHAPETAPAKESLWVTSTTGTGALALDWKPRPGDWRAVVMNADGSRGVTARLQLGARTPLLRWLGAGFLAAAAVAAAAAGALYTRSRSAR